MESLKALQKLSITHNRLHTLPKLDLPELKEVRLNDNKIASIPAGHLPPSLTVLDLGNNLLKTWEYVEPGGSCDIYHGRHENAHPPNTDSFYPLFLSLGTRMH